jgi:hypothetical protein
VLCVSASSCDHAESVREIIEDADVGDESPIHSRRILTRSKVAKRPPETHVASSPYINPESARITHRRNRSKVEPPGSQLEYIHGGAKVEDYLELLM